MLKLGPVTISHVTSFELFETRLSDVMTPLFSKPVPVPAKRPMVSYKIVCEYPTKEYISTEAVKVARMVENTPITPIQFAPISMLTGSKFNTVGIRKATFTTNPDTVEHITGELELVLCDLPVPLDNVTYDDKLHISMLSGGQVSFDPSLTGTDLVFSSPEGDIPTAAAVLLAVSYENSFVQTPIVGKVYPILQHITGTLKTASALFRFDASSGAERDKFEKFSDFFKKNTKSFYNGRKPDDYEKLKATNGKEGRESKTSQLSISTGIKNPFFNALGISNVCIDTKSLNEIPDTAAGVEYSVQMYDSSSVLASQTMNLLAGVDSSSVSKKIEDGMKKYSDEYKKLLEYQKTIYPSTTTAVHSMIDAVQTAVLNGSDLSLKPTNLTDPIVPRYYNKATDLGARGWGFIRNNVTGAYQFVADYSLVDAYDTLAKAYAYTGSIYDRVAKDSSSRWNKAVNSTAVGLFGASPDSLPHYEEYTGYDESAWAGPPKPAEPDLTTFVGPPAPNEDYATEVMYAQAAVYDLAEKELADSNSADAKDFIVDLLFNKEAANLPSESSPEAANNYMRYQMPPYLLFQSDTPSQMLSPSESESNLEPTKSTDGLILTTEVESESVNKRFFNEAAEWAKTSLAATYPNCLCYPVVRISVSSNKSNSALKTPNEAEYELSNFEELMLIDSQDNPAATAVFSIVNFWNEIETDQDEIDKKLGTDEDDNPKDTTSSAPLVFKYLQLGTRISIKYGYEDSYSGLETIFNGNITDIQPDGYRILISAQNDGIALTENVGALPQLLRVHRSGSSLSFHVGDTTLQAFLNSIVKGNYGSSEAEYIARYILALTGAPNLMNPALENQSQGEELGKILTGKNKLSSFYTFAANNPTSLLNPFGSLRDNITANIAIETYKPWLKGFKKPVDLMFVLNNVSAWDALYELLNLYPNNVVHVRPFDNANTIFIGDPDTSNIRISSAGDFSSLQARRDRYKNLFKTNADKLPPKEKMFQSYLNQFPKMKDGTRKALLKEFKKLSFDRWFTNPASYLDKPIFIEDYFSEAGVAAQNKRTKKQIKEYEKTRDRLAEGELENVDAVEINYVMQQHIKAFEEYYWNKIEQIYQSLPENVSTGTMQAVSATPFRRMHPVTAGYNLVFNNIKLQADVRNAVSVNWVSGKTVGGVPFYDPENVVTVAPPNLTQSECNTEYYQPRNISNKEMATRVGFSLLQREYARSYDGEIGLIGLRHIRPYDLLTIHDPVNGYSGVVEVRDSIFYANATHGVMHVVVPNLVARVVKNTNKLATDGIVNDMTLVRLGLVGAAGLASLFVTPWLAVPAAIGGLWIARSPDFLYKIVYGDSVGLSISPILKFSTSGKFKASPLLNDDAKVLDSSGLAANATTSLYNLFDKMGAIPNNTPENVEIEAKTEAATKLMRKGIVPMEMFE